MNGKEYQSLAMRTNDGKATERLLDKYDMIDFFKQAKSAKPSPCRHKPVSKDTTLPTLRRKISS